LLEIFWIKVKQDKVIMKLCPDMYTRHWS